MGILSRGTFSISLPRQGLGAVKARGSGNERGYSPFSVPPFLHPGCTNYYAIILLGWPGTANDR